MAKNIFESVNFRKPKSNKFDLSHEKKLSMKFNHLYPIFHQEVIPGDSFKVSSEIFTRMAPMLSPVMHRVNVYTHYFFVPNRIVWEDWEDFITGGEDGQQVPVFPQMPLQPSTWILFKKGTLADYLGIPVVSSPDDLKVTHLSALPMRAYQTIYNEYFRDQNLEEKVDVKKSSGIITSTEHAHISKLQKRAWEKDYFTSALPWSQRGGEAQIPLGDVPESNITYKPKAVVQNSDIGITTTGNLTYAADGTVITDAGATNQIKNIDQIKVDATTINELRKANKLQEWLEKSARGGSRYAEQLLSFFGVRSDDARLQRPEYLGGGKQPIVISEVLNTTGTENAPQGDMSGHGISVGSGNRFNKKFKEHGQIIGIMSIIPKTAYQNGMEKEWTKFDKFDYYWPEFANLGEQEINASEIFCDFKDESALTRVFGYQQRYAEYKYKQSSVHGDFRDTLAFWHLGRQFATEPVLNETFIHSDARTNIFAVENDTDYFWVQIYNKVSAIRPMPYFSIPEL